MKFLKISQILTFQKIRPNYFMNHRKSFSNLYKENGNKNKRKNNIRKNQFYNESELNPFAPFIDYSEFKTFRPNNFRSSTPYNSSRYNFYKNNKPINKKWGSFTVSRPLRKNSLTENNSLDNQKEIEFNDYVNNINNYKNNYSLTKRNNQFSNSKRNSVDRMDYKFYSPTYMIEKKNIFSNKEEDINMKISEYLNNLHNNKKGINSFYTSKISKKNNFINRSDNKDLYSKKINKSNNNILFGTKYDINDIGNSQLLINNKIKNNNTNYKKTGQKENYFNKKTNTKFKNNFKSNKERLNFTKNQNNKNKNLYYNNNRKINGESNDFFYSFNKENNNLINNTKKNSYISLNPSSLGVEYLKTFYTNNQKASANNLNNGYSNINSTSSRLIDTYSNFKNKLKMSFGEVNEFFNDYNYRKRDNNKDKNEDQKSVQSLQSLSDSKILELANHYVSEEDNSIENYQMNNIIYGKKKKNK